MTALRNSFVPASILVAFRNMFFERYSDFVDRRVTRQVREKVIPELRFSSVPRYLARLVVPDLFQMFFQLFCRSNMREPHLVTQLNAQVAHRVRIRLFPGGGSAIRQVQAVWFVVHKTTRVMNSDRARTRQTTDHIPDECIVASNCLQFIECRPKI